MQWADSSEYLYVLAKPAPPVLYMCMGDMCLGLCMHMCSRMCMCMFMCMCMCMCTCVYVYMYVYSCMVFVCVCVRSVQGSRALVNICTFVFSHLSPIIVDVYGSVYVRV